jgi:hypothetical protein
MSQMAESQNKEQEDFLKQMDKVTNTEGLVDVSIIIIQ